MQIECIIQWNVSYPNFRHPNMSVNQTAFQLLFLINVHIPWHQLHEKTALHVCILLRSIVGGLASSSFAVLSSSLLHLWPCLRCGSENVVCKLPKNESVVCWVFKLQTYGIFIVTDRVQSQHVRITDIALYRWNVIAISVLSEFMFHLCCHGDYTVLCLCRYLVWFFLCV